MFYLKTFDIADHERAFLYEKNRFAGILEPGSHRYVDVFNHIRIERFDITQGELKHDLGKMLVSTFAAQTRDHLESHQLGDYELGLLYVDGRLEDVLPPGSFRMYWKGVEKLELKRLDLHENYRVPADLLALLARGRNQTLQRLAAGYLEYVEVAEQHVGLLSVDGKLVKELAPGSYGFWKLHHNIEVRCIDLRLKNVEISGQEILSKDRVSLRINLSAAYRVVDARLAGEKLANFYEFLYREFQLLLREAVGTRTLDELLNDKDVLNTLIARGMHERVEAYGMHVQSVGVRDIILPGDMKTILNQVVEAEKAAEANLIKRREETAATRSLHNTAKLMEGNPTLMRLKELEVLEKVTERIGNLTVHSGLEGVLKELVSSPS